MKYHFTPARIAILKEKEAAENNSVSKDVEKLEFLYTAGRNETWCSCCGRQFGGSSKS